MRSKTSWLLLFISAPCWAQTDQGLAAVLARLDKLEQQNRELMQEVQALRQQLVSQAPPAPPPEERPPTETRPPAEERLEILEQRTQDLAQTKVEASQRLPISLTGMLLFNAFWNGAYSGAQDNPTVASLNQTPRTAGGTLRQTVLGFKFLSPTTVLGAQVNGSLYMDFYANPVSTFGVERAVSNNLSRLMRLRVATVELDWGSTNLLVGQDKPILSPARTELSCAGRSFSADRRRQSMVVAAPGQDRASLSASTIQRTFVRRWAYSKLPSRAPPYPLNLRPPLKASGLGLKVASPCIPHFSMTATSRLPLDFM